MPAAIPFLRARSRLGQFARVLPTRETPRLARAAAGRCVRPGRNLEARARRGFDLVDDGAGHVARQVLTWGDAPTPQQRSLNCLSLERRRSSVIQGLLSTRAKPSSHLMRSSSCWQADLFDGASELEEPDE